MPINSNGSSLKVETIWGDKTYDNESYIQADYKRNQQRDPDRSRSLSHPMNAHPYGRPPETDAEEFEMPPEMERAIADDLTDKGVAPKPKKKRTRKPKTTE